METLPAKGNHPNAPLTLEIVIADEGELGPAMKALPTDRQRKFVVALLQLGGRRYARAAGDAGFGGDSDALRTTGFRLAHDARIQEAMREEAQRELGASVGVAVDFLNTVIEDETKATKDRLRAVEMLLNRTGLPAQTEHKVTVTHTLSEKEKYDRILELSQKLGLDPKQLLGDAYVDAEFVEISTEGIEDLL